ncbi:peptide ABC transporter permease [Mesobacillus campisalis]|uniref:Peptide ABC transporter permease n=1 Tax=Mesobacillus campisalis TaxID=1408103 RepID=A0A0M2SPB1_9BACI|nr:ABC transporter permease [Mesobacillus campisalis]KKK36409.1 peptide ABC transporter permease [Mesobacillus campisalis]
MHPFSRKENPVKFKKKSLWLESWKRLKKQRAAMIGLSIVLFFVLLGFLSPIITNQPYDGFNPEKTLISPNSEHWFGTDDQGRDIFTRIIFGARISLWIGFFSVIGSIAVGAFLGLLAGYYGKWVDTIISRFFDIMLAFPSILLAIAIVSILGPSLFNALIAIAIINIPTYGRLIRSRVLSVKEEEYIMAAKITGMSDGRLIFGHILPNSITPIIVQGTLGVATAILEAAALGFLGLGAQPGEPEWGKMLADSRQFITTAPWTLLFPGFAIMLVVLGFNMFGDGLRDALDPKTK